MARRGLISLAESAVSSSKLDAASLFISNSAGSKTTTENFTTVPKDIALSSKTFTISHESSALLIISAHLRANAVGNSVGITANIDGVDYSSPLDDGINNLLFLSGGGNPQVKTSVIIPLDLTAGDHTIKLRGAGSGVSFCYGSSWTLIVASK